MDRRVATAANTCRTDGIQRCSPGSLLASTDRCIGNQANPWLWQRLALVLGTLVLFTGLSYAAEPGQDKSKSTKAAVHWAFQPIQRSPIPNGPKYARNPIDAFILARLHESGLDLAPAADRATLFRRLNLMLVGLPPRPEELESFVSSNHPGTYSAAVERLLASPRFGERWAQHWLDVVRYADTDGFEVNTERKNSWPYRDYVIKSFNRNTPYDRFIQEQLAGDALGEDAATGFLVTAAALLPGQIGQDDASKRLARQDELSEMIGNVGQTFLGLTIGCARCHDHKFDPIRAQDYYSIQAMLAGVRYGERASRSPEAQALHRQAETLKDRVAALDLALSQFEPFARPNSKPAEAPNPALNEERFPSVQARFVRFTIHDSNLHPSLGRIEPCVDEFEIFSAGPDSTNVALASLGTRVTASGSRDSDLHRLAQINDGLYGNSRSWMSDQAGKGWVLFELPETKLINRIRWGRDREGHFKDRLPIAYTIHAGTSMDEMKTLVDIPPLRPPPNARRNTDRFPSVTTRKIRFSIQACSSLEPALDEVEVWTAENSPRNVALSATGARASVSSVYLDSPLHQAAHLIDGRFGSSKNWTSSTPGQGWIEIELAREEQIERIVWGTDRDRVALERVPTQYTLEAMDATGAWRLLANHSDRKKYVSGAGPETAIDFSGLNQAATQEANKLLEEKRALQSRIDRLSAQQMVFAGWFADPEPTRLLNRGDPEQPGEVVEPGVPPVLGKANLDPNARESERRRILAQWISQPTNPLAARVIANRLWQWYFGSGFVDTPNDFGLNGSRPTHPELLDWLAAELINSGWSLKHLHRLILHSATFQQHSRIRPEGLAKDADNRLLWRFPTRRLEAELIRDAMLAASGQLNLKMHGPGFDLFKSRGGLNGFPPVESFSGEGLRRMIYAHRVRMESESVFGAFDCPDAGQSMPRRRQSTTPIQALNLFNSRFTLDQSKALAERAQIEAGGAASPTHLVQQIYRMALGRHPAPEESKEAESAIRDHGPTILGRVLFNSSEFLFLP